MNLSQRGMHTGARASGFQIGNRNDFKTDVCRGAALLQGGQDLGGKQYLDQYLWIYRDITLYVLINLHTPYHISICSVGHMATYYSLDIRRIYT